jgi:hypothetical protein
MKGCVPSILQLVSSLLEMALSQQQVRILVKLVESRPWLIATDLALWSEALCVSWLRITLAKRMKLSDT